MPSLRMFPGVPGIAVKPATLLLLALAAAFPPTGAAALEVTEFVIPSGIGPGDITVGPDGNLWFVLQESNQIGRITPAGVVTEFPIPTAESLPQSIALGVDGNLWFTEAKAGQIGRITPQ